jgi:hypothetical protein
MLSEANGTAMYKTRNTENAPQQVRCKRRFMRISLIQKGGAGVANQTRE